MTTMTDRQRQLVTTSFARLVPITGEAAQTFYDRLWEIAPETRVLFRSTDMAQQGTKLMQTLGIAVRGLHDPNSIVPLLRDLGQRHIGYGVTRDQFATVKTALLWMIETRLGREFTPEVRDAWSAAYDMIAAMTLSAYD
jgi:nitric oxide dioxygenase